MRVFKIYTFNNIQICNTVLLTIVTMFYIIFLAFPGGASGKQPVCQCRRHKRHSFDPWVRKIPWRRAWQPTPVILAWRIPSTEEPDGLQSMGSQRVGHYWSDLPHMHAYYIPKTYLFYNWKFVPFHCPWARPRPPPHHALDLCSGSHSVLCICELSSPSCIICFVFKIPHVSEIVWY